jgi:DNA polymerase III delta prime subunit
VRELADLFGRPQAGESILFAGPSGSGKTEVAINLALSLIRTTTSQVTLCDLDVVKAYFRLRDMLRLLSDDEAGRLNIVEPEHRLLHADVPIFPPNLHALLSSRKTVKVIDVGGDAAGIGAVAQFRETIIAGGYRLYIVVNTLRPAMDSADGLKRMFMAIRSSARLDVAGLVANTNLQGETTADDVQHGYEAVKALGDSEGMPVVAVLVSPEYASQVVHRLAPDAAALVSVIRIFNRVLDSVGSQTEF